jgi:hypothetical protein
MFGSQGISVCGRIVRPCTTPCAVHCLSVTARRAIALISRLMLSQKKPKLPEGKTNEGTAQLSETICKKVAKNLEVQKRWNLARVWQKHEKRGGIKSVNCSSGDVKKM